MTDYRWAEKAELPAVAQFLARTIGRDPRYISHGEIQTGLSPDGVSWAANLDRLIAEDLENPGEDRSIVVAQNGSRLVGAAIILWVATERVPYLVLEDLVVDPDLRLAGVGAGLVAFIEEAGRARGMAWAFLESGMGNEGAHRFFERLSYHPMSKVFSKRLA
jgi:GNAT superfamily N-acetyltransferase